MFTKMCSMIIFLFILVVQAHAMERPGVNNTGPLVDESALVEYTGPGTITIDDTVIEGVVVQGTLNIQASNVIVRNFVIHATSFYGINIGSGSNILIEDGIIEGMQSAGILGSNFTARRLEVYNSGADAFKPNSNWLIESSWIHHLGFIENSHADGIQMVAGRNGVARGNYFDMPNGVAGYNNSICIFLGTDFGVIDNILIEENWINGGGWSIQSRDKNDGYGAPTNISILANRFGRDALFGPWVVDGSSRITDNNVWDDTGELLNNQTGSGAGVESKPKAPTNVQVQLL